MIMLNKIKYKSNYDQIYVKSRRCKQTYGDILAIDWQWELESEKRGPEGETAKGHEKSLGVRNVFWYLNYVGFTIIYILVCIYIYIL